MRSGMGTQTVVEVVKKVAVGSGRLAEGKG